MNEWIIQRPELQSWWRRWLYGLLTTGLWVLWIYLWTPLVTLLAWITGVRLFAREMWQPRNMEYLSDLALYGSVLLGILLTITAWSAYNLYRFRGLDRRRPMPDVRIEEEAEAFGCPTDTVRRLRTAGVATVEFDEAGQPRRVVIADPAAPPADPARARPARARA